jgi:hypothetical protein
MKSKIVTILTFLFLFNNVESFAQISPTAQGALTLKEQIAALSAAIDGQKAAASEMGKRIAELENTTQSYFEIGTGLWLAAIPKRPGDALLNFALRAGALGSVVMGSTTLYIRRSHIPEIKSQLEIASQYTGVLEQRRANLVALELSRNNKK